MVLHIQELTGVKMNVGEQNVSQILVKESNHQITEEERIPPIVMIG